MILDLTNKEIEDRFLKKLDLLVYEVGTLKKKYLELTCGDDTLQIIPSLSKGEIKYILAIDKKFILAEEDQRKEKYWYKIVKNFYAKNKRPLLKQAFVKKCGKKEGLKRFDEEIERANIVLYSAIFPNSLALVRKLKNINNLEISEEF